MHQQRHTAYRPSDVDSCLIYSIQACAKKISALGSAFQTDQPIHSQSAKTENLPTEFTQLSTLFLLDPVYAALVQPVALGDTW